MFHTLDQVVLNPQTEKGTVKVFVGDGSPYLKIGHAKRVDSVRINGMVIPREHRLPYPHPKNPERLINILSEVWRAVKDVQGETVILRSIQSNDGLWQKDVRIFVVGEWEDEEAEATAPAKPEKPGK